MSTKPSFGTPFSIATTDGEILMEALVVIVPDGHTAPPQRLLPGLPPPLLIERRQWACMVRQWRRERPWGRISRPTVREVILSAIQRQGVGALTLAAA